MELAIAEEKAKAAKNNETSEPIGSIPQNAETVRKAKPFTSDDESRAKELDLELQDLKITNRAKDMYIEKLETERINFIDQLLAATHKVGTLEAKLLQIEPSKHLRVDAK